jgi:hypothetical protein
MGFSPMLPPQPDSVHVGASEKSLRTWVARTVRSLPNPHTYDLEVSYRSSTMAFAIVEVTPKARPKP